MNLSEDLVFSAFRNVSVENKNVGGVQAKCEKWFVVQCLSHTLDINFSNDQMKVHAMKFCVFN